MTHEPRTTGTKVCHGPLHPEGKELSVLAFAAQKSCTDGLKKCCRDCNVYMEKPRNDAKKFSKLHYNWRITFS